MAEEPEDPEKAADRLEAALERIAHLATIRPAQVEPAPMPPHDAEPTPESDLTIPEIAERLDSLIGRLRAALGKTD